jgi:DNA-binding MarR family transcriptional regulator
VYRIARDRIKKASVRRATAGSAAGCRPRDEGDDGGDGEPAPRDEPRRPPADPWSDPVRQWVIRMTLQRLRDDRIPERERRLLAWIAYELTMSEHVDVAVVTWRFLATDVRMTAAEAEAALDALIERGFVRAEYRLSDETRLALQLVVQGMNDARRGPSEH